MFQLHCCFYYYCIAQGVQKIIFSAPIFVSKSVGYTVLCSCKTTFARDCIFVEGEIFVRHPVHVLYYCCHKVQSQQKWLGIILQDFHCLPNPLFLKKEGENFTNSLHSTPGFSEQKSVYSASKHLSFSTLLFHLVVANYYFFTTFNVYFCKDALFPPISLRDGWCSSQVKLLMVKARKNEKNKETLEKSVVVSCYCTLLLLTRTFPAFLSFLS